MPVLNICFKVHMPYGLNNYAASHIGSLSDYFSTAADRAMADQLADECYLPANRIMTGLLTQLQHKFKISYSISGTTLEILQALRPDVIASFKVLAATGDVEFLGETYYNSLSWLYSKKEFAQQVEMHSALVENIFGKRPSVLRNTELIYNNELASFAGKAGFRGILCEGVEKILKGRSPNHVYTAPGAANTCLLLRNASLSDDIAFRFDDPHWNQHPLTAVKYASWLHAHKNATAISLFMDYETFGIHKKSSTGIFEFLENLPGEILKDRDWSFGLPSAILAAHTATDQYDVPQTISWGDREIECCVWCENMMQNNMLKKIYSLENMLHKTACKQSFSHWRQLQSADYFYYMSDKARTGPDSYQAHNPFPSAESAYKNYVNITTDFEIQLINKGLSAFKEEYRYLKQTSLY